MTIQLKSLHFSMNALEPIVSAKTFEFHYGKHYATYVNNTNDLIANTPMQDMDLVSIIRHCSGKEEFQSLFNNAAQVFNHEFFWNSLTDKAENKIIPDVLADYIVRDFGSYEAFETALLQTAVKQFGSGSREEDFTFYEEYDQLRPQALWPHNVNISSNISLSNLCKKF